MSELTSGLLDEDRPKLLNTRSMSNNVGKLPPTSINGRRNSNMSKGRTNSDYSDDMEVIKKIENSDEPDYPEVEVKEIMEYYKPTWLAYAGFTASVFASLSLPLFGFVLSKYIFVLSMYHTTEALTHNVPELRNWWTLAFICLCLGIGFTTYF